MTLVADRFVVHEQDCVTDLATGETVRLTIARALSRADAEARAAICDRLAGLSHPLLVPLVDYGSVGRDWFEAHSVIPALRVSDLDARRAALHLVRFLRATDVMLSGDAAARHVRPAIEGASTGWRPIGCFLHWRAALEAVRTVLESPGPPGVTAIIIHATEGAGLRTARLQLARVARLAGYAVIDSRFGALPGVFAAARHVCVFDWLSTVPALPSILSVAAATGACRHAWIRFCRRPEPGSSSLELEPLPMRDLTNVVFLDDEVGPTAGQVRSAAATARGRPGALISALSKAGSGRGASWVHETAPAYDGRVPEAVGHVPDAVGHVPDAIETRAAVIDPRAGVGRLQRAVDAALALARRGRHARAAGALARCAEGLEVRGARTAAEETWCALGELHLSRGKPERAAEAFERARRRVTDPSIALRALIGTGVSHLERGRLADAEAAFRTALLAESDPVQQGRARVHLAFTLFLMRRFDSAEEILATESSALLSRIRLAAGDLSGAAVAAKRALDGLAAEPEPTSPAVAFPAARSAERADSERAASEPAASEPADPATAAGAHLAAAWVDAALGRADEVRRHVVSADRKSVV